MKVLQFNLSLFCTFMGKICSDPEYKMTSDILISIQNKFKYYFLKIGHTPSLDQLHE